MRLLRTKLHRTACGIRRPMDRHALASRGCSALSLRCLPAETAPVSRKAVHRELAVPTR